MSSFSDEMGAIDLSAEIRSDPCSALNARPEHMTDQIVSMSLLVKLPNKAMRDVTDNYIPSICNRQAFHLKGLGQKCTKNIIWDFHFEGKGR